MAPIRKERLSLYLEGLEKSHEKPQDVPCLPETLDRCLPNERWSVKAT